jgi:hypothetical protein
MRTCPNGGAAEHSISLQLQQFHAAVCLIVPLMTSQHMMCSLSMALGCWMYASSDAEEVRPSTSAAA